MPLRAFLLFGPYAREGVFLPPGPHQGGENSPLPPTPQGKNPSAAGRPPHFSTVVRTPPPPGPKNNPFSGGCTLYGQGRLILPNFALQIKSFQCVRQENVPGFANGE